jgi:hypothetical protein
VAAYRFGEWLARQFSDFGREAKLQVEELSAVGLRIRRVGVFGAQCDA